MTLPPTVPPSLSDLAFVLGRWSDGQTVEQWTAAADGFWGVGFGPDSSYEILRIEEVDGAVRLLARPGGRQATPFPRADASSGSATFLNPSHDHPQRVRYASRGRRLEAAIGPAEGPDSARWRYLPQPVERISALEEADRAFASDVASRGIEAWIEAFDPGGHQWDDQRGLAIRPGDEMRRYMSGILSGRLEWEPIASGLSPAGDQGFTVGVWTWTGDQGRTGRGSYVTVWRRQADGSWKIGYDGGDPS